MIERFLPQFLAGMAGRIPLGRMGKAEEFARMACFLCSDAGSFVTGVAINVDGGARLYPPLSCSFDRPVAPSAEHTSIGSFSLHTLLLVVTEALER